jgi:hypothetical protein
MAGQKIYTIEHNHGTVRAVFSFTDQDSDAHRACMEPILESMRRALHDEHLDIVGHDIEEAALCFDAITAQHFDRPITEHHSWSQPH